ncbi:MAG: glycerol-3-phosphate acyltransferase [Coriobacteriia bacterium]|nr:glycerol-3-phosphate acyltransferase [Coriobacteriia bacterium]
MTLVAWTAVFVVFSYAVCGVPFGLVIAQRLGHVDVRRTGSGNIGATNVARSAGKAAGVLTLACDAAKGLACMLLSRWLISLIVYGVSGFAPQLGYAGEGAISMSLVFAACILGHVFSPYLHFHGGKGIAVGVGATFGLWWPVALGLIAVFAVVAVATRYVSAASVTAAVSLPLQCLAWGFAQEALWPVAVVAAVVVIAHRGNIARLVKKEEPKFAFKSAETPTQEGTEEVAAAEDAEGQHFSAAPGTDGETSAADAGAGDADEPGEAGAPAEKAPAHFSAEPGPDGDETAEANSDDASDQALIDTDEADQ